MDRLTVEISSYPRSGNTYFCRLTSGLIAQLSGLDFHRPRGIHQNPEKILEGRPWAAIPGTGLSVSAYKSHLVEHPLARPDKIIYLYRHPLSVLLSSLNYYYHLDLRGQLPEPAKARLFLKGRPKSVSQIQQDGELEYYFDRFYEDLGQSLFPWLKKEGNYANSVTKAFAHPRVTSLRYEALVDEPAARTLEVWEAVLGTDLSGTPDDFLKAAEDPAKARTNSRKKNALVSLGRGGTGYQEYLSPGQIVKFETKHRALLEQIGYSPTQ